MKTFSSAILILVILALSVSTQALYLEGKSQFILQEYDQFFLH